MDIVREGKGTEVAIGSVGKDCPVRDLYFMALSWLEMDFPLQIYVPCRKESLVDQRGNDLVLLAKLSFGHVDPCSGIPEFFPVFPVSEPGVIRVFVGNRAVIDFFRTAVADIGSPVKPDAALFFKVSAGLVAGRTGCAFDSAQDNLSTGVRFLTVIAVNTEVFGIIESPFVIPV